MTHDGDDDDDDDDDDDVSALVTERGQLLYTQHPYNTSLKHLLPQSHAVKQCRGFDFRHLCFLAGQSRLLFSTVYKCNCITAI